MSRVGKKPINIPAGVKVSGSGQVVVIEGPLGKLSQTIPVCLKTEVKGTQLLIKIVEGNDDPRAQALQGLVRALAENMVQGTTKGYSRSLMIEGTGFRAAVQDGKLTLTLGFTHPVIFAIPKELNISVEKQIQITVKGFDKQLVGAWASKIRGVRPPEPYKGKGVRYFNEYIKKKVGKAAVKQGG